VGATGDVRICIGARGAWTQIAYFAAAHTGAAKVVLMGATGTAGVQMYADVHQIAPPGVFTSLPRAT
jgi:hypothetical protein